MAGVLKSGDIRSKLEHKFGFQRSERSDHPEYHLVVDGRVLATTHLSHKSRGADIGPTLQSLMARQPGVSAPQFRAMIRCTMSREEYISHLK